MCMSQKTTIYFPDEMKFAIEREAKMRNCSEAQVIRDAVSEAISKPKPNPGIFSCEPIADKVDEMLEGFGER